MSKIIDSLVQASINSKNYAGVILARLEFDTPVGIQRFSNAYQTIYWDDFGTGENAYLGLGNLADVSVLAETAELGAVSIQLSLSGIPANYLNAAFSDTYRNRPIYLYYGTLNTSTYAVEGGSSGPVLIFAGLMDYANIEFGQTATVVITATSRLTDWEKVRGGTFSDSYQKNYVDPTDKGFRNVKAIQNKVISWGSYTLDDGTSSDSTGKRRKRGHNGGGTGQGPG